MVVTQFYDLAKWLPGAIAYFFELGAALALAGDRRFVSGCRVPLRPLAGGDMVFRVATTAAVDLARTSPRRVWALAAVGDSGIAAPQRAGRAGRVRGGVAVCRLVSRRYFARSEHLVSHVRAHGDDLPGLGAGCVSQRVQPAGRFQERATIYTVVTKPVRPGEIVLGRILGFTLIGSVMLAIMGVISYVFAYPLARSHPRSRGRPVCKRPARRAEGGLIGRTTSSHGHRHEVRWMPTATGKTDTKNGHWHNVTARGSEGDKTFYTLSAPKECLSHACRSTASCSSKTAPAGGSIAGSASARNGSIAALSREDRRRPRFGPFRTSRPSDFPTGLPIEMTIRVFRSHKGDINKGIAGSLMVRNPKTGRSSQEIHVHRQGRDRRLQENSRRTARSSGQKLNLFNDLVDDGDGRNEINCLERGQYFGMAMPDLYLRAADASFEINFAKAFFGIWLTMVLVISFAVMFSTFLSGPVAMLATVAILVIGCFTEDIHDLANGITQGGGPFESLVRIVKQQNMTIEMEEGLTKTVVQSVDCGDVVSDERGGLACSPISASSTRRSCPTWPRDSTFRPTRSESGDCGAWPISAWPSWWDTSF